MFVMLAAIYFSLLPCIAPLHCVSSVYYDMQAWCIYETAHTFNVLKGFVMSCIDTKSMKLRKMSYCKSAECLFIISLFYMTFVFEGMNSTFEKCLQKHSTKGFHAISSSDFERITTISQ